jgi:hypothetical protein
LPTISLDNHINTPIHQFLNRVTKIKMPTRIIRQHNNIIPQLCSQRRRRQSTQPIAMRSYNGKIMRLVENLVPIINGSNSGFARAALNAPFTSARRKRKALDMRAVQRFDDVEIGHLFCAIMYGDDGFLDEGLVVAFASVFHCVWDAVVGEAEVE